MRSNWLAAAATSVALALCAGCGASLPGRAPAASDGDIGAPLAQRRIEHVIVLIQENRSFNDLFATFPGAQGTTVGKTSNGQAIRLRKSPLAVRVDYGHSWTSFLAAYDGRKMDGFNLESGIDNGHAGTGPYQYVDPKDIVPYWDLATQYALADNLFQTQGSGSFTAHQDLIRGGTALHGSGSLIDSPSHTPWGCDAPLGTTTSLLTPAQKYEPYGGPYPCLKYPTLRDLLDAKGVSWKYYSPPVDGSTGATWNAFDAIAAVRHGSQWKTNVTSTDKAFFDDLAGGRLAAVSWIVPDKTNSDHPGNHSDTGPSWVASVTNAVGKSAYWKTSAVLVVWDDWGGLYDPAAPPFRDHSGGLGFRVPLIVVSPYARPHFISHTQYEFGSIVRFIEDNWNLGRLNTTDVRATSILGCFDFAQAPRTFSPVRARYPHEFFERQAPSHEPVDDE